MTRLILIPLLFLFVSRAWTQQVHNHQYSSIPDSARFEIVQSDWGVRYTFKIDKYIGEVFQLVKSVDDKLAWETLGNGPLVDLALEAALDVFSELTPEEISEFSKMSFDKFSELDLMSDKVSLLSSDKVNFQLFISGVGIRYTFLLHLHTGKTWQLVKDKDTDKLFWSVVE